jgi:hypothetical protein
VPIPTPAAIAPLPAPLPEPLSALSVTAQPTHDAQSKILLRNLDSWLATIRYQTPYQIEHLDGYSDEDDQVVKM